MWDPKKGLVASVITVTPRTVTSYHGYPEYLTVFEGTQRIIERKYWIYLGYLDYERRKRTHAIKKALASTEEVNNFHSL